MMKPWTNILLLAPWLLLCFAPGNCDIETDSSVIWGSNEFDRELISQDKNATVKIKWHVSLINEEIMFEVTAATSGWVGFGFTYNEGKNKVDMCIGGVYQNGEKYFQDRYSHNNTEPPIIDDSPDWNFITASEFSGTTKLQFSRKFNTGDAKHDLIIQNKTCLLLWAVGDSDEISDEDNHKEHRGVIEANLLEERPEEAATDRTSTITTINTPPEVETSTPLETATSFGMSRNKIRHKMYLLIHFISLVILLPAI